LVIIASEDGAIVDGIMLGADDEESAVDEPAVDEEPESSLLPQAAIEIEKTVAAARAVSFVARMVRSSSLGTFTLDSVRTGERIGAVSS
jgi:hypothetical protein